MSLVGRVLSREGFQRILPTKFKCNMTWPNATIWMQFYLQMKTRFIFKWVQYCRCAVLINIKEFKLTINHKFPTKIKFSSQLTLTWPVASVEPIVQPWNKFFWFINVCKVVSLFSFISQVQTNKKNTLISLAHSLQKFLLFKYTHQTKVYHPCTALRAYVKWDRAWRIVQTDVDNVSKEVGNP